MDLLNRFLGRGRNRRLDPNAPHAFRSVDIVAMMAAGDLLGQGRAEGQAATLILANDAARAEGCRLRGCGRPADDPIHT